MQRSPSRWPAVRNIPVAVSNPLHVALPWFALALLVLWRPAALPAQTAGVFNRGDATVTIGKVAVGGLMIHPLYISLGVEREIAELVYGDGLLRREDNGMAVGALAALPQTVDGGRNWVFNVQAGIEFHDGVALTSADIVFSYLFYKQSKAYDPIFHRYFQNLESVQALDPLTVRFVMREALREFPLALGTLPIMPKHQYDRRYVAESQAVVDPNRPIGLGPFRVETWPFYDTVILSANKRWYRGKPGLDGIVYRFYASSDEVQAAFVKREVDMIEVEWANDLAELKRARENGKIQAVEPGHQAFAAILYNNQNGIFSSRAVRQALTYATDRQSILSRIMMPGTGELAHSPIDGSFWGRGNSVRYGYEPARALEILQKAGWQNTRQDGILRNGKQVLRFEILFPQGSVSAEKIVRMVKLNLSDIGIHVIPTPVDQKELVQRLRLGAYESALFVQDFDPSADGFYGMFHSESIDPGFNTLRYVNRQVDRGISFLFGIPDRSRALPIYQGLQMLISEDQPCMFLYFVNVRYIAFDPRIRHIGLPGAPLNSPASWFIEEGR